VSNQLQLLNIIKFTFNVFINREGFIIYNHIKFLMLIGNSELVSTYYLVTSNLCILDSRRLGNRVIQGVIDRTDFWNNSCSN